MTEQFHFLYFTWLFWKINGVKNCIDHRASYVGSEVLLCRPGTRMSIRELSASTRRLLFRLQGLLEPSEGLLYQSEGRLPLSEGIIYRLEG